MAKPNNNAAGHHRHHHRRRDHDYKTRRQLALVKPPTATITNRPTGFTLPENWVVEEVPRSASSHVDKYYYEPGTGRKFRSLRAVERYINGTEEEFTRHKHRKIAGQRQMIIYGGKMVRLTKEILNRNKLAVVPSRKTAANSPPYNLPDGWCVEKVPRRSGFHHPDKYYYEPGTGRKFRTLSGAQRYVAELNEDTPLSAFVAEMKDMNRPLAKAFKLRKGRKKSAACKKKSTRKEDQPPSPFVSVPEKVEWVLDSYAGDEWKTFVFDRAIPDSVKEQWKERFHLVMNAGIPNATDSTPLR